MASQVPKMQTVRQNPSTQTVRKSGSLSCTCCSPLPNGNDVHDGLYILLLCMLMILRLCFWMLPMHS